MAEHRVIEGPRGLKIVMVPLGEDEKLRCDAPQCIRQGVAAKKGGKKAYIMAAFHLRRDYKYPEDDDDVVGHPIANVCEKCVEHYRLLYG